MSRPVAHTPDGSRVIAAQCEICANVMDEVEEEAPSHFLRILVGFWLVVIIMVVLEVAAVVVVVAVAAW